MKETSFEGLIEHYKEGKITDMKNPSCNNCNECCGILTMLLPDEFEKLKKYLKKEGKEQFKQAKKRFKENMQGQQVNLMCPFNTRNRKCSIYSHRPSLCRGFHCSPEFAKNYDKSKYEDNAHKVIWDLFKNS